MEVHLELWLALSISEGLTNGHVPKTGKIQSFVFAKNKKKVILVFVQQMEIGN